MKNKFDLNKPETLFIDENMDEDIVYNFNVELFRKILLHCYDMNVSDILWVKDFPVMVKINGLVFPISKTKIQLQTMVNLSAFVSYLKEGDDSAYLNVMNGITINSSYLFKVRRSTGVIPVRYRTNIIKEGYDSVMATMRLNDFDIKKLEQIGLSESNIIYQEMFPKKGLVLITGATDSGKTTLINSCLQHFIIHSPKNVVINTYESPIESDLKSVLIKNNVYNKVVSQVEVPGGTPNFSTAMEESLRRNSDIIITGEIRTADDVSAVLKGIMSTGRLIMGTMHTDKVSATINRMLNMINTNSEAELKTKIYDLISALHMIVSQKLLETVDKKRVAVNEVLIFTQSIKEELLDLPIEKISERINQIMIESKDTMVDKAKKLLTENVISQETYNDFAKSFSY